MDRSAWDKMPTRWTVHAVAAVSLSSLRNERKPNESSTFRRDEMKTLKILRATLLSAILTASFPSVAQDRAAGSKAAEAIRIIKVEFVPEYQILTKATAKPKPGGVIAVVQLSLEGDVRDVSIGLDDYVYQFADRASKVNTLTAFAVGEQFELVNGQMEQWWHVTGAGLITGTVEAGHSQPIDGLTVLALLPDYATSFTLTIKHLHFKSESIDGPGKSKPAK